jgi:hypothetical protein
MRYVGYVGKGFQHSSGRVIALGRLMLATLFLLAVWMDASQPTHAPTTTYQLIAAYIAFAAIVTFSTGTIGGSTRSWRSTMRSTSPCSRYWYC